MASQEARVGTPLSAYSRTGYDWHGINPQQLEVLPSCGGQDGQHYCLTHLEKFPNNVTACGHTDSGQHVMAWLCHEHGIEVP